MKISSQNVLLSKEVSKKREMHYCHYYALISVSPEGGGGDTGWGGDFD